MNSTSVGALGMFKAFLAYELAEQGNKLVKADKWLPPSKTCSAGGAQ
ncbi:MAG: hypothetical protein LBU32_08900 [Clostridiales bacterium]|nr:hypothetical protein [Clostridiales bacterium]